MPNCSSLSFFCELIKNNKKKKKPHSVSVQLRITPDVVNLGCLIIRLTQSAEIVLVLLPSLHSLHRMRTFDTEKG
uniref:Uncharacterized protein n=1 Tax=Pristionchus pacificus TaxID=54126 RepID=A0A2A6BTK7_PRIPA|eukprot:PDM69197.1 hypothetical protein PRIPAC_47499 [Pristionchus pacificus]